MYYVKGEKHAYLYPKDFVVQCAWCRVIMSGHAQGDILEELLPYATHGCCKKCQQKVLRGRRERKRCTYL